MNGADWQQCETLTDRYFMVTLGRPGTLLVLLAQAPLIAALIVLVWQGARPDGRLELFLCLAALWLGCMNACREIVKERALYRRERMVFLNLHPYLLSKSFVLAGLGAVQAASLLWIVHRWVGLPGSKALLFGALWLGTLVGSQLGLVVSAVVRSPDAAVGLVPLVVLPQILLSRPFLPEGSPEGVVALIEDFMPLKWIWRLYGEIVQLPKDPRWLDLGQALGLSLLCLVVLHGLSGFLLWFQDE